MDRFLGSARDLAEQNQYCVPYLVSLGLLLNRAPLYAGTEEVIPPDWVERAFEVLSDLDWASPISWKPRRSFCAPRA